MEVVLLRAHPHTSPALESTSIDPCCQPCGPLRRSRSVQFLLCKAPHNRKNWLFPGSDSGAERAAIFYTLIRSSKLNRLYAIRSPASANTRSTDSTSCFPGTAADKRRKASPRAARCQALAMAGLGARLLSTSRMTMISVDGADWQ
jgi:hypothetical protein